MDENVINTQVKVVAWLWMANGLLSVCMAVSSLGFINLDVLDTGIDDPLFFSFGSLCFFLPGVIANILAGWGLLNYKNWARILVIILAVLNLLLFPIGTTIGIYALIIMFIKETEVLFRGETPAAEMGEGS
jgi:hypothetical protein